jgi:pilus assembly protein Flp/PilA
MTGHESRAFLVCSDGASREANNMKGTHMFSLVHNLFLWLRTRDERGATAVEYGMIVALIAGVIILAVTAVGTDVKNAFDTVAGGF